jgi:uncharacterized membrane protein
VTFGAVLESSAVTDSEQSSDRSSPSKDERLLAMLAHVLSCFGGGFIAPLLILLAKRDSRFVRFHALQALLISVAMFGVFLGGCFLAMFVVMSKQMVRASVAPPAHPVPPPPAFFLMFPVLFVAMGGWVISGIVLGACANSGRWSALPGFGWLTLKILGPRDA